jgi:cytosine/adenosine deaminase-related metal-dependent hydrolase
VAASPLVVSLEHPAAVAIVKVSVVPMDRDRVVAGAARFLNRENEFGTIVVGQRADLLLLDANPLENVANAGAA